MQAWRAKDIELKTGLEFMNNTNSTTMTRQKKTTFSNSTDKRWKNIELNTAKTKKEREGEKCTEQKKECIYTQFTSY